MPPAAVGGSGGGAVGGEMASAELLSQFVRSDFDTNDYLRAAVRNNSVSDDLSHLKQGISVLEAQLRQQVVSHHDRLIEQVSHAKNLEALVGTVSAGVGNLQESLNKVGCLPASSSKGPIRTQNTIRPSPLPCLTTRSCLPETASLQPEYGRCLFVSGDEI